MSSDEIALRVKNLTKRYEIYEKPVNRLKQFIFPKFCRLFGVKSSQYFREFWALDDISFEIKKGETVGIIGRNGSGKSTLLQIVCGTLSPSSGEVLVSGKVAALLELGSGFNPEFTGRENVYLNAAVLGLSKEETDARFLDIERFADIGDFIGQPVKTYSSGMMVRLAFAVIAHVNADILVIDEALSVGDVFFTQKCMRFLRKFMENGTILFVSHDIGAITTLCTESLLLSKGKVLAAGKPKMVSEKYLEELYGENQAVEVPKEKAAPVKKPPASQTVDYKDIREHIINESRLRNDIEIFQFDEKLSDFGVGGVSIEAVTIFDCEGARLLWLVGGEDIVMKITCVAKIEVYSPIIGFQFKDKLGQIIFCDNTYIAYQEKPILVRAGEKFSAKFEFRLPILPVGDYSISPAVAEGSQEDHVQHHWIHDAVTFRVHASSICMGLVGLAMKNISLEVETPLSLETSKVQE